MHMLRADQALKWASHVTDHASVLIIGSVRCTFLRLLLGRLTVLELEIYELVSVLHVRCTSRLDRHQAQRFQIPPYELLLLLAVMKKSY